MWDVQLQLMQHVHGENGAQKRLLPRRVERRIAAETYQTYSHIFTHDLCTIKLKPGRFPAMFYRWQQLTRFIQKFTNFRCVASKLLQNRIIKSPGSSASTFGQRAAAEQHGMPHLPLQTSSCSTAQQPMVVKQLHGQHLDPVAGQPIKLMGML